HNTRFAARCMCAAQGAASNRCGKRIAAQIDLNDEGLHPGLSRHLFDVCYSTLLCALFSNPAIRNERAFLYPCSARNVHLIEAVGSAIGRISAAVPDYDG